MAAKKSITVDFYTKCCAGRTGYGPCPHQAALDEIAKGTLDPDACCRTARDGFAKAPLWAALIIGGADSATLDAMAASGCSFGAGTKPSVFAAAKIAIEQNLRTEPLLWALRQAQAGKLPAPSKSELDEILFALSGIEARNCAGITSPYFSAHKSQADLKTACAELRKAGAALSPEQLGTIWTHARLSLPWLSNELKASPLPPGSELAFTKAVGKCLKEAGLDSFMLEGDLEEAMAASVQYLPGMAGANPFPAPAAGKSPKTMDRWIEWVQCGEQTAKLGLPLDMAAACQSGHHRLVAMASASAPPNSLQGTGLLADWLQGCIGSDTLADEQMLMAFTGIFSTNANPWAHCAIATQTLIDLGAPFDVPGANGKTAQQTVDKALSGKNPAAGAFGMLGAMGLNNAQSLAGMLGMMGMGSLPGQGTPCPDNPKTREDFLEWMRIALERHALDKAAAPGKKNGPAQKSI